MCCNAMRYIVQAMCAVVCCVFWCLCCCSLSDSLSCGPCPSTMSLYSRYRRDCAIPCNASQCFPHGVYNPEPRAQCSPDGVCECLDSTAGHWAGAVCNECSLGYWGTDCTRSCGCSGHGSCGWLDGECTCFASPELGFWSATDCSECAAGYLAPACRARNVRVSRSSEVPGFIQGLQEPMSHVLVVDGMHGLQYVGCHPMLLLTLDGQQVCHRHFNP